jgi:hypothetical protein
MRRAVGMTRHAISPRLAMRILENMATAYNRRTAGGKAVAKWSIRRAGTGA